MARLGVGIHRWVLGENMISEIDLKDWGIQSPDTKKLYEVPRNTLVSAVGQEGQPFLFHHVDGMYSYCTLLDGTVWHPSVSLEVFLWKKK